MISALHFKERWKSLMGEDLMPFHFDTLKDLNLNDTSIDFLITTGLPSDAAPFLSLVQVGGDKYNAICTLTDLFGFLEPDFDKYIVIGSCCDGDVIVINSAKNDCIEYLDHEDNFTASFFNTSINTFCECLLIYNDFVHHVNKENGNDAYFDSNFTDDQFDILKRKLTMSDVDILEVDGFWKAAIEMDLGMRDEIRKSTL